MKILNTSQKLENILISLNATNIQIGSESFSFKINSYYIIAYNLKTYYDKIFKLIVYVFSNNNDTVRVKCNIKTLKQTLIGIGIIK